MKPVIQIRAAQDSDVSAITEIYRYHVLHGTASFETDPPDVEEMALRMSDIVTRGLPYLVADISGGVVGYGTPHPIEPGLLIDSLWKIQCMFITPTQDAESASRCSKH